LVEDIPGKNGTLQKLWTILSNGIHKRFDKFV
jgi:hypothetical protein